MADEQTNPFKKNKNEIFWNLINAGLAGGLVLFGSLSSGDITWRGIIASVMAALVIGVAKFRDYWSSEEHEYTKKLFCFVR